MTNTTRYDPSEFAGLQGMVKSDCEEDVGFDDYADILARAEAAEAERDALQAKLAVAVEALSSAADDLDDYSPLTGNTIETTASRSARAALAQLTADTPKEAPTNDQ